MKFWSDIFAARFVTHYDQQTLHHLPQSLLPPTPSPALQQPAIIIVYYVNIVTLLLWFIYLLASSMTWHTNKLTFLQFKHMSRVYMSRGWHLWRHYIAVSCVRIMWSWYRIHSCAIQWKLFVSTQWDIVVSRCPCRPLTPNDAHCLTVSVAHDFLLWSVLILHITTHSEKYNHYPYSPTEIDGMHISIRVKFGLPTVRGYDSLCFVCLFDNL